MVRKGLFVMNVTLLMAAVGLAATSTQLMLYDFSNGATTNDFYEVSDTVRTVGLSKADFTLVQSQAVRRAVFFALLNPQPNGAGFAGVEVSKLYAHDWSKYEYIVITGRTQGAFSVFKVVLNNSPGTNGTTFSLQFDTKLGSDKTYRLPLEDFKCDYRGAECDQKLNLKDIYTLGLQAPGGVYEEYKQSGPATFEIDQIYLE